jgi:hypothetical protein
MPMLLAVVLAFVDARAEDVPVETAPSPSDVVARPATDPAAALAEAKEQYVRGEHDDALVLFEALRARAAATQDVPPAIRDDVLAYLGEIRYILGDYETARGLFRELLAANPSYTMSPLNHPITIVGAFESVRSELPSRFDQEEAPVVLKKIPAWGYLPLGGPQFAQGQVVKGTAYAVVQGAAAATTIAVLGNLQALNGTVFEGPVWEPEDYPRIWNQVQVQRYGVQVPLTAAFYLTWLASGLDGRARWRRTQTEGAPEVGAWPPPETLPSTADHWATLRAVMEGGATFSSTDVPEAAPIPLER